MSGTEHDRDEERSRPETHASGERKEPLAAKRKLLGSAHDEKTPAQPRAYRNAASRARATESTRKWPDRWRTSRMADSAAKPHAEPSQNLLPNARRGGMP